MATQAGVMAMGVAYGYHSIADLESHSNVTILKNFDELVEMFAR